jgi:hypothetical protein
VARTAVTVAATTRIGRLNVLFIYARFRSQCTAARNRDGNCPSYGTSQGCRQSVALIRLRFIADINRLDTRPKLSRCCRGVNEVWLLLVLMTRQHAFCGNNCLPKARTNSAWSSSRGNPRGFSADWGPFVELLPQTGISVH